MMSGPAGEERWLVPLTGAPPPCPTPPQKLPAALPTSLASDVRKIPVVYNQQEFLLIRAIARAEALGLLSEGFP